MWTAFVWLTTGLVRGLVITETELGISLHNITIREVERGVLGRPLIIKLVELEY